jgi:hypothetical protein
MVQVKEEASMEAVGLRELVEKVTRGIRGLEQQGTTEHGFLERLGCDWKALTSALALGPTPDRDCPHCGRLGMRDATLCGYCWKRLKAVVT